MRLLCKKYGKTFLGYEGFYQVSNFGNVKALSKYKKNHSKYQYVSEKILSKVKMNNGYYSVGFCVNKKRKCFLIHRLVAQLFVPNPNHYNIINHIDGNKLNNLFTNLEWCTQSYNVQHSYDNNFNSRKRKVVQYNLDGKMIKIWDSVSSAIKYYNNTSISAVCLGKRKTASNFIWKYL